MPPVRVFEEPESPIVGPFRGLADWYRRCCTPQAQSARAAINAWYATFPDRAQMLLSRLRSVADVEVEQATDELYAHHSPVPYMRGSV